MSSTLGPNSHSPASAAMAEEGKEFMRRDLRFSGSYGGVVLQSLLFAFRPYRARLIALFVMGLLGRLAFLGSAWMAGIWVDTRDSERTVRQLPDFFFRFSSLDFVAAIGGLALFGFVLSVAFRIPFTRTGALSAGRLYDAVTRHTSRLPQSFFDRTPVGRIMSRFSSDYGAVLRMAGGPLGELLSIAMDLILLITLIAWTHWALLPVVALTMAVNAGIYRMFRGRLRDARRETSLRRGPSIAHFAETSQGHATIRLFQKTDSFRRRFSSVLGDYLEVRLDATRVVQSFSFAMVASTATLLLVMGAAGLYLFSEGLLSVGEFSVAFTFVLLLSTATQQFFDYIGRFDEALTGVERLGEYFGVAPEPGSGGDPVEDFVQQPRPHGPSFEQRSPAGLAEHGRGDQAASRIEIPGAVLIRDLEFSYSQDGPRILSGLHLDVAYGEKLGVVGRTGSGKSSLLSCLFHLYPIESGLVSVCGRIPESMADSKDYWEKRLGQRLECAELLAFRLQMALIAQEPVLFRGTLEDNLRIGAAHISREQMLEALVQVGLEGWLKELIGRVSTEALSSSITEGGLNLSAGQRQLVCVARALLEDSPIVVMDEATSFVDPRSEESLLRATRELLRERTQIVVAHRLSTLEDCDRILWLDQGRMRALGPAGEVLREFRKGRIPGPKI